MEYQWQNELKKLAGYSEEEWNDPRQWELMVATARACLDLIEDRMEFPRRELSEEDNIKANAECAAIVKTIKTWFRANGQIDD